MHASETSRFREIAVLPRKVPGSRKRLIVWCGDVPYFADFETHGAGYYHRFVVRRADDGFRRTLADTPWELFADPEDVGDEPAAYIEAVMACHMK